MIGRGKFQFHQELRFHSLVHMPSSICLPISPEEFQSGLKAPLGSTEGIWKKASEQVSETVTISLAPGYDPECKMVIS